MEGCRPTSISPTAGRWPGRPEESLDRALVAGLLLELVLETPEPPADPQVCRSLIKARLKHSLVAHLAGQVSLDRFRRLVGNLEHWFTFYYPLVCSKPEPAPAPAGPGAQAPARPRPSPPPRRALQEERLQTWLENQVQGILPQRPHRKLSPEKLYEFLCHTQGGWFRIKDFQQHFHVDRKTAWEYLQKFLTAGLLRHNRERSAAVRYCLDTAFLLVQGEAVRREVGQALAPQGPALAAGVADWLIASGGQAFWQEEWHGQLEAGRCQQVVSRLLLQGVLEVAHQSGPRRLLRLPSRWLQTSVNEK